MYKLIIFDVDGTLIDTEKAVFLTYQKVVNEELGRQFTQEDLSVAYGVPTHEALAKLGIEDVEAAGIKYHKYLMEAFCRVEPFAGIINVLEALKNKDIVMGIVTSRNRFEVLEDICLQGLMKYFKYVICADDTQKHKPDPEPLLKIIQLAECDISDTIYIGDTPYDYKCARSAGVDFALALWGAKNTESIHADYEIREPEQVLDILERTE